MVFRDIVVTKIFLVVIFYYTGQEFNATSYHIVYFWDLMSGINQSTSLILSGMHQVISKHTMPEINQMSVTYKTCALYLTYTIPMTHLLDYI